MRGARNRVSKETMMARYYLDITLGGAFIKDEEGVDLPSTD